MQKGASKAGAEARRAETLEDSSASTRNFHSADTQIQVDLILAAGDRESEAAAVGQSP